MAKSLALHFQLPRMPVRELLPSINQMTALEQIQQDIQALPQDALDLVAQFIQFLKKRGSAPSESPPAIEASPPLVTADWSDLIGCVEAEEDLSVNYKAYLAEGWAQKYGDH
jgi:hypothetical protein